MHTRTVPTCLLTATLLGVLTSATITPAGAQGDPVAGDGHVYYFSGAYNANGVAQAVHVFGDPDDEVYIGDWYGDDVDLPMIRRGNVFFVPDPVNPRVTAAEFAYGDPDDEIYVGDWDGDGVDTLAVRRGNEYLVKNDNEVSGVADTVFSYGEDDDYVLVGDWDASDGPAAWGDTLAVVRGNEFFVKNDLETGVADYTFAYGNLDDEVLVGDWAIGYWDPATRREVWESSDGNDQLAVRRGNTYFISDELWHTQVTGVDPYSLRTFTFGNHDDAVFVASLPTAVDDDGRYTSRDRATRYIAGDGLGVRRPW